MTEEERLQNRVSMLESELRLRHKSRALEFYERVFVAAIERGAHLDTARDIAHQAKEYWKAEVESEISIEEVHIARPRKP